MAKVALLIGVSEYEPGLTPLPAATKDVEAMQRVLENPEIGGFDEVIPLLNPQRHEMEEAIETFFENRQKDDLLLLFFSGHGIKDESGKLYFAARNTRKSDKGVPARATTVPANFVHEVMSNSRSKREVVILDCCFSGAFAEGMAAKDDGFVDVKNQLGGEGRAVLTSSTSTQLAFEQQGVDTSTYTSYIIEGLETGAADRDEDGWISVDELHEYAAKKVQESTPAMKPEIYPVKGGFKIKLAKAPSNDPRLTYLREVEYWVEGGNGEISVAGRAALDALQETLTLSPEDGVAIETQVLAPIENKKIKLQRYELAFRDEIRQGFPLSDRTGANLKRLQQALGLRDEDIALIEAPIIAEQPLTAPPVVVNFPPSRLQNSNFLQYVGTSIIGVFFGGILVYFLLPRTLNTPQPIVQTPINLCTKETYSLNDRISLGEEILLKQDTNSNKENKEAGVKAFAKGDCQTAIDKFNSYRTTNRTDPEALIYLNNAQARQKGNYLKIAVSVPISNNLELSQEMLRGVAQAQDEVNKNGGINDKLLQVVIANDDNDPNIASNIATQFINDNSILAVVGPNSTSALINAATVYLQKGNGLVMISPTSSAALPQFYNYVFRTSLRTNLVAEKLSNYAIKNVPNSNILFCAYYSTSIDHQSLKDEFTKAIKSVGGQINPTDCNISASNFDPNAVISQAIASAANGLLLTFPIDEMKKGLAVAQANKGRLPLFSNPGLYTQKILQEGKGDVDGMVLVVPWYPQAFTGYPFGQNALKLWGGTVNWRTATTYDATLAIIAGLRETNKRNELQKVLHSPTFSVDGATGKIQFLPSGDRKDNPMFLVQVQRKAGTTGTNRYEFVPIKP
ncbi:caspase, EACC1-associated type [Nostoc sp. 'Peltigera malacea cyanobiont' DB3992]|uniref:caspase, EACC1-associated type n=1 Tax=Nostoc sp. 'Peltigera malacea cyanobiont' DB3992 TaxID=1206980 RepID=UPI000C03C288|nr:ABC transporter substrate-binding protein [Nostoc sp. 'Peltigera malacea cyanobiont' DB3992]PHM10448.1 ABC transporter substrate-binding protein [Nostoc sp. 'Peltigera malacea cyanobiont' DB3992]